MNTENNDTFRTKTGVCTVTPERIVLTRGGVSGAAAAQIAGNNIRRTLLLYSVFGGAALLFGLWSAYRGSVIPGVLLSLVGIIFLCNVVASRNNSAAAVIDRASIRAVKAHPPHPPFTRGYFDVFFLEDGKERKRIIMLPGSMSNGEEEYQQAVAVMRDSGLLAPR